MHYKYGVSFNCQVGEYGNRDDIGGGGEGDMTTDYVGNSIDRIFNRIKDDSPEQREHYILITEDHSYIGQDVAQISQGEVVAVIAEHHPDDPDDLPSTIAVIFTKPNFPTIVE